jgi:aconitate hydratase
MGQAPATGKNSLRTTPRNFPGRSGTPEDKVWLCSPETAAASALVGKIFDPRKLEIDYPLNLVPATNEVDMRLFDAPDKAYRSTELVKGPNIASLPELGSLPSSLAVKVILKLNDNISTDEILPAGADALPYRSNIPKISGFCFRRIDPEYVAHAISCRNDGGHAVLAGKNYGQGSSREHAALAPRYLGLWVVVAESFARIYQQNLVNFGILPLRFSNADDLQTLEAGDVIVLDDIRKSISESKKITALVKGKNMVVELNHDLTHREREIILAGGLINWLKSKTAQKSE